MNVVKRLRHLAGKSSSDRQLGKSTLIAKAAKELNGIFLVHDFKLTKIFEKSYGVVTRCAFENLEGYNGPFFFDHLVVETLFLQAASKIESAEQELESSKERIAFLEKELAASASKIEKIESDLFSTTSLLTRINSAIIKARIEVMGMS